MLLFLKPFSSLEWFLSFVPSFCIEESIILSGNSLFYCRCIEITAIRPPVKAPPTGQTLFRNLPQVKLNLLLTLEILLAILIVVSRPQTGALLCTLPTMKGLIAPQIMASPRQKSAQQDTMLMLNIPDYPQKTKTQVFKTSRQKDFIYDTTGFGKSKMLQPRIILLYIVWSIACSWNV